MVKYQTFLNCLIPLIFETFLSDGHPLNTNSQIQTELQLQRDPRQLNIQQRPDGTIAGSFSLANAVDLPGFDNSFAVSEAFEIGPRGFSSSSASAFDSDIGGNRMSFANSQAQNSVLGGGMSAANAMANSFSNPLFSGSNSNANSFGTSIGNLLGK